MTLPLLVFSDLDGTLLDHHSYDWSPAKPTLDRVTALGGGVVLASSKTGAEIAVLRDEMGLADWPAIVENGAGLLEPGASPDAGGDYAKLRETLGALPKALRRYFRGFGDMSTADIADVTGLHNDAARRAGARAFSEPGLWSSDAEARAAFCDMLEKQGVTARMGGRFLTLSFGRTKADAMAELVARFAPRHTIALGDAPNDVEMLEAADLGILIPNPDAPDIGPLMGEATGAIRRAPEPGPVGWNLALGQAIDDLKISSGGPADG